jgi:hypothetical protein
VIIVVKGFWTLRDNIYECVINVAKVMLLIDLVPSGYYNDVCILLLICPIFLTGNLLVMFVLWIVDYDIRFTTSYHLPRV